MKKIFGICIAVLILNSCNNKNEYDATGMFETDEIIVSSESSGKILSLNVEMGDTLVTNQNVGCIDTSQLYLSKIQIAKNRNSVQQNRPQVDVQVAAIKEQINKQITEKTRLEKLFASNAATQKQLDDINSAIDVLRKQLAAQQSTLNNNYQSLDYQSSALDVQIAQINDKLQKSRVQSPISGTVLDKYHYAGEFVGVGTPLFKIGDIENLFLRAYVTSGQLSSIKLGQKVRVFADFGGDKVKVYKGVVAWISSKSEFTPKGIQTSDERENSVYAIKIKVKNDGYIKIGMYGEIKL